MIYHPPLPSFFFFNDTATTEIYTLSLHDALPICLTINDIDLFEVNEAFGGVPLMFQQEFGIPDDRLNVNGGSMAIGHPLGSTGARMLTDLLYELERRGGRYGLQTICEASGTANTTIIE